MLSKTAYNIKAKISLLPTRLGGRQNPVATGYRPALAFNTAQHYSGEIELLDRPQLKPGNSGTVFIRLIPAKHIRKNLKSNDAFTLREGSKAIGSGIIVSAEIVSSELASFNSSLFAVDQTPTLIKRYDVKYFHDFRREKNSP